VQRRLAVVVLLGVLVQRRVTREARHDRAAATRRHEGFFKVGERPVGLEREGAGGDLQIVQVKHHTDRVLLPLPQPG